MTQVEYNARYATYRAEQKRIEREAAAKKQSVEAGSEAEEAIESEEDSAFNAAKTSFLSDTASFKSA